MLPASLQTPHRGDLPAVRVRFSGENRPTYRLTSGRVGQWDPIVGLVAIPDDELEELVGADTAYVHLGFERKGPSQPEEIMPGLPSECIFCGYSALEVPPQLTERIYPLRCRGCGEFSITFDALHTLRELPRPDRLRLGWLTRESWERGQTLTFRNDNIQQLLSVAPRRSTPLDSLDRLVVFIGEHARSAEQMVPVFLYDFPADRSESADELLFLEKILHEELKFVHRSGETEFRLTPKGWERLLELRRATVRRPDQAFIAMWFDSEMDLAYSEGIEPAIREARYKPLRIDRTEHINRIDDEIVAGIRKSGLMVADFTGHRQGVYYEAGFAEGLGIPVIRTCRADQLSGLHFDTRQYNHVVWASPEELRKRLRDRIEATVPLIL